ncbi:hypothetical protein [Catellatospora methionotrophica]|uniref:PIN-like domain-containing protein n=1 Tax=Catellatospora methionotrophica TaxID=121620 RepID=UPI0033C39891
MDENVARPLAVALRSFLTAHTLHHLTELDGWAGTPDVDLYKRAAQDGYEAILTTDGRQMQRPNEVAAIADAGIHRIEFSQRHSGLVGLGVAIGAVCAGLPIALAALENAPTQLLVQLNGISPTARDRLRVTDPAMAAPKHWPG